MTTGMRSFFAVFASLTFIGQAMAVVNVPCAMMDTDSPGMVLMAGMDHSVPTTHASADASSESGTLSIDCCGEAFCSMSHCVGSSTFSVSSTPQIDPGGTSVLNTPYTISYLAPETLSLFRPPIAR